MVFFSQMAYVNYNLYQIISALKLTYFMDLNILLDYYYFPYRQYVNILYFYSIILKPFYFILFLFKVKFFIYNQKIININNYIKFKK